MFDDLCLHVYQVVIVQCTLDGSAIQTFLSWRGGKPAETMIQKRKGEKKPESPCKFPATSHDFELVSLLRHNVTPAQ